MTRYPHGPNCIACTDPAAAADQVREHHAELEATAARARQHRQWGDWLKSTFYRFAAAGGSEEFQLAQNLLRHHLQTANALASGVGFDRAHIERVLAAHPAVREALAEARNPKEAPE